MLSIRTSLLPWRRHAALLLWLVLALTVFKAATPLLAAWSAQRQGLAVAEVCSVYGVRTVALAVDAAPAAPAGHDSGLAHAAEHCALGAVVWAALTTITLPAVLLHAPAHALLAADVLGAIAPPDATQLWVAARKHGPPRHA
jgi:hypothetical protein